MSSLDGSSFVVSQTSFHPCLEQWNCIRGQATGMSQPPLDPSKHQGALCGRPLPALLQVARFGRPTSSLAPLFSSLLLAHLTPWREGREQGRGRSRMYGKKSGQLANRGSGFPRLSVSTVPCSRGRVSLPWPALVSQLEKEGLARTGVSGP